MSTSPWPPASAISRARRASAWPRTSARSGISSSGPPPAEDAAAGASSGTSSPGWRGAGRATRRPRSDVDCLASVPAPTTSIPAHQARLVDAHRRGRPPARRRDGRAPRPSAGAPARVAPRRRGRAPRAAPSGRAACTCSEPTRIGDRDPQVERGAGLRHVGRGQVHRDAARRVHEPAVAEGAAHPLAGLAKRGVGEADDREAGQARAPRRPRRGRAAPRGRGGSRQGRLRAWAAR